MERKIKLKKNITKLLPVAMFMLTALFMALPSILYLIQNKTVYRFYFVWTYLFRIPTTSSEKLLNAIIIFAFFTILFLLYILIIKKRNKIFRSKKQIFIVIAIVAILFAIIIPYTSTDVYSYIANGWSAAHYGENPYYISTGEIAKATGQNEPMFNKVANCWKYETVVYGPLWTAICTLFSWLSFGNIDIALFIFKFANLIIHLINSIIIYKITRRKLFVLLYGLNPFILFEALSNVHNDIFLVFFILLSIYFVLRKKNLFLAVAFIAFATAIKYLAILLLPFIVIYYVRKKDLRQRIKYCVLCGIEYVIILTLLYLIYMRNLEVFAGLFIQQAKYNRSIFFILYEIFGDRINIIQNIVLVLFAILYIYVCIKLLKQKEMKFNQIIYKYNIILIIFTFVLITNFNPWYVMWLFPTMFWLKSKSQETILALSYSCQIGNLIYISLYSEAAKLGVYYFAIMVMGTVVIKLLNKEIKRNKNEAIKEYK